MHIEVYSQFQNSQKLFITQREFFFYAFFLWSCAFHLATHDLILPTKHNVIMSQLIIIRVPKCVNDIESPYSS